MEVFLLREYVRLVLEMPHLELRGCRALFPSGGCVSVIDFRIERLPMRPDDKKRLMLAFGRGGFVGNIMGTDYTFSSESLATCSTSEESSTLPRLPDGWVDNAVFVED